jgi:hypothetical protein
MAVLLHYPDVAHAEVNPLENIWRAAVNASISRHCERYATHTRLPVELWLHIMRLATPHVPFVYDVRRTTRNVYRAACLDEPFA